MKAKKKRGPRAINKKKEGESSKYPKILQIKRIDRVEVLSLRGIFYKYK
jgi:hypothetical protein